MIVLILFTRPHNALVSSNANLGKKLPKNDATITRKKDDATVKMVQGIYLQKFSLVSETSFS